VTRAEEGYDKKKNHIDWLEKQVVLCKGLSAEIDEACCALYCPQDVSEILRICEVIVCIM